MSGIRPLVTVDAQGAYRVDEETCAWLARRTQPFAVLACAGKFRTGKSFLLNRLLDRPPGEGFGVGETVQACTRGIWVCTDFLQDGVLVLDTEGIDALDAASEHDVRVFAIAVLVCTAFAYNSMSHLDEAAVQTLSLMTKISDALGATTPHHPTLYWILRDFALQMVDADGKPLKNADYLEQALSNEHKCATRDAIRAVFPERHLVTLPRPHKGETAQKLDAKGAAALAPKFERYLAIFRDHLCAHAPRFSVDGTPVGGAVYAQHVRHVVAAVNAEGAIPCVADAWTLLARAQRAETLRAHADALRARVHAACPRAPRAEVEAWVRAEAERVAGAEDAAQLLPALLAQAEERVTAAHDAARAEVARRVAAFLPAAPAEAADALPDGEVGALVRAQLLAHFAGGALHARVVAAARADEGARCAAEADVLRAELVRKEEEEEAEADKKAREREDACTMTEEEEEAEDKDAEHARTLVELEAVLATNADRAAAATTRAEGAEARCAALATAFDAAMEDMRGEVGAAAEERDRAVAHLAALSAQKDAVDAELARARDDVRAAHAQTAEVHRGVLDELRRRDADARALGAAHHAEVCALRVGAAEARALKRRVDELLGVEEEAKRLRGERARAEVERDAARAQGASLRAEVEALRAAHGELETRIAVLHATAKLEACRKR